MKKDDLGNRMKGYENISRNYLTKKIPVIIRLDGKAFHTFTKGLKRPFDELLISTMQETARLLCENIQGCKLAYTQSDEITLLLTDFENINSCGWFDYNVQKMVSISASMATLYFNKVFRQNVKSISSNINVFDDDYLELLENKLDRAMFDSRVFSIPKEEVCNCFIWRQQDATRNSIQMVGQSQFSHKELQNKSCNNIQDMLFTQKDINWNDLPVYLKRGVCIKKEYYFIPSPNAVQRSRWIIDNNTPIFSENREYVEMFL